MQDRRDETDASARPLRRDAVINRERISAAARELFAERGLEASLADIAELANVGLGTIYRNFKDKDDLIASLLEEKLEIISTIIADVEGLDTGWAAFSALVERLIESFVADRSLEEIMLSDDGHRYARTTLDALAPGASRIIERAKLEGSLRGEIEFNDLPMILMMLKGIVDVTAIVNPGKWRRYMQILLSGLSANGDVRLDTEPLSDEQLSELSANAVARRLFRGRVTPSTSD